MEEVLKVFSLHVHDLNFSTSELVINPEAFPDVRTKDFVEVSRLGAPKNTRLVLQVESLNPIKGGRLQVSVLKSVAELFGLAAFQEVVVRKVNPKSVGVSFVEFTVKDQFIPRADTWRFKNAVFGSAVHRGKVFNLLGMRARVRELNRQGRAVASGVLTESTNFIFRSRSSRIFWLVQMSAEMYDYAPDGRLYMEIFIHSFVKTLLEKWKALQATHSLTVVLFCRTVFLNRVDASAVRDGLHNRAVSVVPAGAATATPAPTSSLAAAAAAAAAVSSGGSGGPAPAGFAYEDCYKVVLENETTTDAGRLMRLLKQEMVAFPRLVGWGKPVSLQARQAAQASSSSSGSSGGSGGSSSSSPSAASKGAAESSRSGGEGGGASGALAWPQGAPLGPTQAVGVPSLAAHGNFLEAINVTLNVLEKHYMDRDLTRSGNSIVTVSTSSGVFEVDPYLAGITKQRMMDNGIGMDMVSLSQPPLHTAPLFIHRGGDRAFEVPHWMNLSFAATPDDSSDADLLDGPAPVPPAPPPAGNASSASVVTTPGSKLQQSQKADQNGSGPSTTLVVSASSPALAGAMGATRDSSREWRSGGARTPPDEEREGKRRAGKRRAEENALPVPKLVNGRALPRSSDGSVDVAGAIAKLPRALRLLLGLEESGSNGGAGLLTGAGPAATPSDAAESRGGHQQDSDALALREPPLHVWGALSGTSPSMLLRLTADSAGSNSSPAPIHIYAREVSEWGIGSLGGTTMLSVGSRSPGQRKTPWNHQPLLLAASASPQGERTLVAARGSSGWRPLVQSSSGSGGGGGSGSGGGGGSSSGGESGGAIRRSATIAHVERAPQSEADLELMFKAHDDEVFRPIALAPPHSASSSQLSHSVHGMQRHGNPPSALHMQLAHTISGADRSNHGTPSSDDGGIGPLRRAAKAAAAAGNGEATDWQEHARDPGRGIRRAAASLSGSEMPPAAADVMCVETTAPLAGGQAAALDRPQHTQQQQPQQQQQQQEQQRQQQRRNVKEATEPSLGALAAASSTSPKQGKRRQRFWQAQQADPRQQQVTDQPQPPPPPPPASQTPQQGYRGLPMSPVLMPVALSRVGSSGGNVSVPYTAAGAGAGFGRRPGGMPLPIPVRVEGMAAAPANNVATAARLRNTSSALLAAAGAPANRTAGSGSSARAAAGATAVQTAAANDGPAKPAFKDAAGALVVSGATNGSSGAARLALSARVSRPVPVNTSASVDRDGAEADARGNSPHRAYDVEGAASSLDNEEAAGGPSRLSQSLDDGRNERLGSRSGRSRVLTPTAAAAMAAAAAAAAAGAGNGGGAGITSGRSPSSSSGLRENAAAPGTSPGGWVEGGLLQPPSSELVRRNTFTRATFAGMGPGQKAPLRRDVTRQAGTPRKAINPFKRQDEEDILRIRTHNRRRWSHVFPPGEIEFKQMPGPIWKSLCQPAILPLTTDYLPPREEVDRDYSESFWALTLPDADDPLTKRYNTDAELLEELVCQRLAQDFQLVEGDIIGVSVKGSGTGGSRGNYGYLPRRAVHSLTHALGAAAGGPRLIYILSMGHRIHCLSLDEHSRQVEVKRYVSRYGSNEAEGNRLSYRYSLWLPLEERFQTVRQTFNKYPNPEYTWNYVDELVNGDNEQLTEFTKYRRVLFTIIPPVVKNAEEEQAFIATMRKLEDFINSKRDRSAEPLNYEFQLLFPPAAPAAVSGSSSSAAAAATTAAAAVAAAASAPSVVANTEEVTGGPAGVSNSASAANSASHSASSSTNALNAAFAASGASGSSSGPVGAATAAHAAALPASAAGSLSGGVTGNEKPPAAEEPSKLSVPLVDGGKEKASTAANDAALPTTAAAAGSAPNSSSASTSSAAVATLAAALAVNARNSLSSGHSRSGSLSDAPTNSTASGAGTVASTTTPRLRSSLSRSPAPPRAARTVAQQTQTVRVEIHEGKRSYYEWLNVVSDKRVDSRRVVRLEVNWLVCSGVGVAEFVSSLHRRTAQLGLRFVQVPQFSRSPMINVHPFITHPYLPVPSAAVRAAVEAQLCGARLDFVRDADVKTDWKEFGLTDLPLPAAPPGGLLAGALQAGQRAPLAGVAPPPPPPQPGAAYMHRSGTAFVRVAPRGFVFMANARVSAPALAEPAAASPQRILKELKEVVAAAEGIRELVLQVVYGVLQQVEAEADAGARSDEEVEVDSGRREPLPPPPPLTPRVTFGPLGQEDGNELKRQDAANIAHM